MAACFRCMYTPTECIRESLLCNGTPDCPHGEDESGCNPECFRPNKYVCPSNPYMCIDIHQKCDRVSNCDRGEDEQDCANNVWVLAIVVVVLLLVALVLWCHFRKHGHCRRRNHAQETQGSSPSTADAQPPSYEDAIQSGETNLAFQYSVSPTVTTRSRTPPPEYSSVSHIMPPVGSHSSMNEVAQDRAPAAPSEQVTVNVSNNNAAIHIGRTVQNNEQSETSGEDSPGMLIISNSAPKDVANTESSTDPTQDESIEGGAVNRGNETAVQIVSGTGQVMGSNGVENGNQSEVVSETELVQRGDGANAGESEAVLRSSLCEDIVASV